MAHHCYLTLSNRLHTQCDRLPAATVQSKQLAAQKATVTHSDAEAMVIGVQEAMLSGVLKLL